MTMTEIFIWQILTGSIVCIAGIAFFGASIIEAIWERYERNQEAKEEVDLLIKSAESKQ